MRAALVIIALVVIALALWFGARALAPAPEAESAAPLPLYLGGEDGAFAEEEEPFGPGPTVCSMDPRYRPRPGAEQTCPVVQ